MTINIGQLVTRKSYGNDVIFRVTDVMAQGHQAYLYGHDLRLEADAPIDDLVLLSQQELLQRQFRQAHLEEQNLRLFTKTRDEMRQIQQYEATSGYSSNVSFFQMPGKVLHLDGDMLYLKKCIQLYEQLGVPAHGVFCKETEMPDKIDALLETYMPDILVLTGHDAYQKSKGNIHQMEAYRHSKHFVSAVQSARKKVPSLDQLVIFAGACQSNFEAIIRAGANFASSPARININALDPVYVVAKVSFTSLMEKVNLWELIRNTFVGERGLGGVDTRGVLRTGLPFGMYQGEEE